MNISIREAEAGDFDDIRALAQQMHRLHVTHRPDLYADVDPLSPEYYRGLLEDEQMLVLAAQAGGRVIGFCLTLLRKPSANPLVIPRVTASMDNLCVHEEFRQLGVGKMLFDAALERARQRGAAALELNVLAFNTTAIQFYETMGMSVKNVIMEIKT